MAPSPLSPPRDPPPPPRTRRSLPSLFDRLCTDAVDLRSAAVRREAWRALVLRDLQLLLNTANHESLLDPRRHAALRASCWNFGLDGTAGDFMGPAAWVRVEAGTEVYLSLVDQFDAPFRADLDQLSVRAWLTNRDLAMGMARPAPECRALGLQAGVAGAAMLRAPSPPAPALGLQHSAWSLIRLLGMHHLPLAELDAQSAAQALRELLGLFAQPADAAAARRIDGLLGARMHATTRRLPQPGPLVYGRTLECDLQVDDEAFAPASPLLFGMVLERLLGEYASINTCTSLRLHSAQRGPLWCSPARMGSRGIV